MVVYVLPRGWAGDPPDYLVVQATWETELRLANPWPKAIITRLDDQEVLAAEIEGTIEVQLPLGVDCLIAPDGMVLGRLPEVSFDFSAGAEVGVAADPD